MRAISKTTYHFSQDGPGDAIDEGPTRRSIKDLDGLLGLGAGVPCSGPELRAIKAMTEGFTVEQYRVYKLLVCREIDARRSRHENLAPTAPFSRAVLEQLSSIEALAKRVFLEIDGLIPAAEPSHVTGLEQNSADRAAERAAEFVAESVGRPL